MFVFIDIMKYAHIADVHIGGWRDESLSRLTLDSFLKAMDVCEKEKVDFILIAGDLFNTSIPSIDMLKTITSKLYDLKKKNINIYLIPGSHDFSPSGKTMIDVIENAGLVKNVSRGNIKDNRLYLKFHTDNKTGAKITGVLGKKGMLDKMYYDSLAKEHLENEEGYKIFMFHNAIEELMPKELSFVESMSVNFFPKNFNYYAGGHIHIVNRIDYSGSPVCYPGPLFPNNFDELEQLGRGGFNIIETIEGKDNIYFVPIEIKQHINLNLKKELWDIEELINVLNKKIEDTDANDKIITMRLKGKIRNGKVTDIPFKDIIQKLYDKGAYVVLKNTTKLNVFETTKFEVKSGSVEQLEEETINESNSNYSLFGDNEKKIVKDLMDLMKEGSKSGETNADFENRIIDDIKDTIE